MPKKTKKETPTAVELPSLRIGAKGDYVAALQTNLKNRGYDVGGEDKDCVFGEKTLEAVKEFQKDTGVPVPSGVVGKKTWIALQESKIVKLPKKEKRGCTLS